MAKTDKQKMTLEQIMANINKSSGSEIARMGLSTTTYRRIPFTSPRMNYCTYGGLPTGRIIEFYGEEHGGKTTSALDNLANYQQIDDRKAVWVDVENTLDYEWATKLGVDVDSLCIVQPESESAEELFQMVLEMIDTGEVGYVVIDSIGAMLSAQELEKTVEDKTYGGISMALTRFAKEAEMKCKKRDCTLIAINQIRDDMNAMYPGATRTVGGRAFKHFASVRLEFRKGSYLNEAGDEIKKSSESPAGNIVLMTMTKNKTCPPNRRGGFYSIDYASGVNYLRDLVDVALKYNLIDKSGSWYTIVDPDTGEIKSDKVQGMPNIYEYLKDETHEDVLTFMEEYIDRQI